MFLVQNYSIVKCNSDFIISLTVKKKNRLLNAHFGKSVLGLIVLIPGAVSHAQLAVEVVVHKLLDVPPPLDQNHCDYYNNYGNCYSFISPL